MRSIKYNPELYELSKRVIHHAKAFGRTLPEIRFFVLDANEFASLLEKKVYPTSPVNIWEGRDMVSRRHRVESGQESSIYYEVVQTGDPSYAYLNHTNNAMMQASVMAHVVGHCEFSEINVMKDSDPGRTEYVMHLVKKVDLGRWQMGDAQYRQYWNACESLTSLIAVNSQYNLKNTVDTDSKMSFRVKDEIENKDDSKPYEIYSSTLSEMLGNNSSEDALQQEMKSKVRNETISRMGYKLRAPCQDVMGFLREFSPASEAEKSVLDYLYVVHKPQDFVIRNQIMNEGWAMYWEKKIMLELFKEKAIKGMIDYSKVFSGVCYPRPFFQRNPYHLGYHMWCHIEELFKQGRVSLDFHEEIDLEKKKKWDKQDQRDPVEKMTNLVRTITDYEFLRRFLTPELVKKFHLNRIDRRMVRDLGIQPNDIVEDDERYVWLQPEPVKNQMLEFFTHLYRPRIYVLDSDFHDGGLLLYHRNDGQKLKKNWIEPTLKNINLIWKHPVSILTQGTLCQYGAGRYKETEVGELPFEEVVERMRRGEKPLRG